MKRSKISKKFAGEAIKDSLLPAGMRVRGNVRVPDWMEKEASIIEASGIRFNPSINFKEIVKKLENKQRVPISSKNYDRLIDYIDKIDHPFYDYLASDWDGDPKHGKLIAYFKNAPMMNARRKVRKNPRSGGLDAFTNAYLLAALWSSTDNSNDQGGDPLDKNYDISDLAPEAVAQAKTDCATFQKKAESLLRFVSDKEDDEQAGHDFWLTRNGHGAGFWDRGLGSAGEKLTELSKKFGEIDIYVGDDGKLYFSGGKTPNSRGARRNPVSLVRSTKQERMWHTAKQYAAHSRGGYGLAVAIYKKMRKKFASRQLPSFYGKKLKLKKRGLSRRRVL